MRQSIDKSSWEEILQTTERSYTRELSWDADANEVFIEGAVVDDIHQAIFDGEAPKNFAAVYIHVPGEEPRKALSDRRRQEVRNFLQRNWRGPGGVLLAEKMIDRTIQTVIANHRHGQSLS